MSILKETDAEVFNILEEEKNRQQSKLSLIASENFFSSSVREAVGSVMMHKYSEGNIGQRYYEGNKHIDELETLAIARAREVFNLPSDWTANVQALSGSNANLSVYLALLEAGDTIMGMYLPDGGHLSHGWSYEPKRADDPRAEAYWGGSRKVHITSRMFRTVQYKTNADTRMLDYDSIRSLALKSKPKLIITGGTAYTRLIDHEKIKAIADEVGAYYLADIAHEAGLIASEVIPSPVGIADVVTMTTHKTLRSGRGAIILSSNDLIKKINKAVLPGLQGGPHNHNIAGICVGLGEALKEEFKEYSFQVVSNAKYLAEELKKLGFHLVTGGTDKHLLLIDLSAEKLSARYFARALDMAGLVTNFNTMPQETGSPANPSALRIGTPWMTTRGLKEMEMTKVSVWMRAVLNTCTPWFDLEKDEFEERVMSSLEISNVREEVHALCLKYPLKIEEKHPVEAN